MCKFHGLPHRALSEFCLRDRDTAGCLEVTQPSELVEPEINSRSRHSQKKISRLAGLPKEPPLIHKDMTLFSPSLEKQISVIPHAQFLQLPANDVKADG